MRTSHPNFLFYFVVMKHIRNNILTLFSSQTNNRVFPLIMRAWHINKWVLDQFGISIEVKNYKEDFNEKKKKKILSISVLGQFLFIL